MTLMMVITHNIVYIAIKMVHEKLYLMNLCKLLCDEALELLDGNAVSVNLHPKVLEDTCLSWLTLMHIVVHDRRALHELCDKAC